MPPDHEQRLSKVETQTINLQDYITDVKTEMQKEFAKLNTGLLELKLERAKQTGFIGGIVVVTTGIFSIIAVLINKFSHLGG